MKKENTNKTIKSDEAGNVNKGGMLLKKHIRRNIFSFILGIVFLMVGTLLSLLIPEILRQFVDSSLMKGGGDALGNLSMLVMVSILVYLLKGLFFYLKERLIAFGAFKSINELRCDIFRSAENFPYKYFINKRSGDFVSGITSNVSVIEDFLTNSFPGFFSQPAIILGLLALIFFTNWKLALVSLLLFPLMFSAMSFFGTKSRSFSGQLQEGMMSIASFLYENFSNIRIIKLYCKEKEEALRFEEKSQGIMDISLKGVRVAAVMTPVIELISCAGLASFFWYGGREIINGNLTPGELIKFITCITMLVPYLKGLGNDFAKYQKMKGALDGISEVFISISPESMQSGIKLRNIQGNIRFEGVSFKYEQEAGWVLKDVNLDIKPGEKIAIIGRNGAGKTTLVNLLPRLFEPQEGRIVIDGFDIRDIDITSLRSRISVIPQELNLFNESVYFNIAFGQKDIDREKVYTAARKAKADDFISTLPYGYDTIIGERGEKLSAGQRQRIAIARAILTEPDILILDEATSALDSESEQIVQEVLQKFADCRNLFVIAHKYSSLLKADRIIVLDKGSVAEFGTHEELLLTSGFYAKLCRKYAQERNSE